MKAASDLTKEIKTTDQNKQNEMASRNKVIKAKENRRHSNNFERRTLSRDGYGGHFQVNPLRNDNGHEIPQEFNYPKGQKIKIRDDFDINMRLNHENYSLNRTNPYHNPEKNYQFMEPYRGHPSAINMYEMQDRNFMPQFEPRKIMERESVPNFNRYQMEVPRQYERCYQMPNERDNNYNMLNPHNLRDFQPNFQYQQLQNQKYQLHHQNEKHQQYQQPQQHHYQNINNKVNQYHDIARYDMNRMMMNNEADGYDMNRMMINNLQREKSHTYDYSNEMGQRKFFQENNHRTFEHFEPEQYRDYKQFQQEEKFRNICNYPEVANYKQHNNRQINPYANNEFQEKHERIIHENFENGNYKKKKLYHRNPYNNNERPYPMQYQRRFEEMDEYSLPNQNQFAQKSMNEFNRPDIEWRKYQNEGSSNFNERRMQGNRFRGENNCVEFGYQQKKMYEKENVRQIPEKFYPEKFELDNYGNYYPEELRRKEALYNNIRRKEIAINRPSSFINHNEFNNLGYNNMYKSPLQNRINREEIKEKFLKHEKNHVEKISPLKK